VRQRVGWLAVVGVAVLLAVAGWVWRRRRPQPELAALYGRLGRWGRRLGAPPGAGDTPGQFARQLGDRVLAREGGAAQPALEQVQRFVRSFEAAQYGPRPIEAERETRGLWPGVERALRGLWRRRLWRRG
jgi:LPXTG-motif cell wall-anchored protein